MVNEVPMPKKQPALMPDERLGQVNVNQADLERRMIYLCEDIDEDTAGRFMTAFHVMDDHDDKPISVILNTGGGNVCDGFAIYDTIRFAKSEVLVIGTGAVQSMGVVIMQAADRRLLMPSTSVMIHDLSIGLGDVSMTGLRAEVSDMEMKERQVMEILAAASGKPLRDIAKLCRRTTYMTASEAVAAGLADEVLQPRKKRGS